jgi:hypothetical protein
MGPFFKQGSSQGRKHMQTIALTCGWAAALGGAGLLATPLLAAAPADAPPAEWRVAERGQDFAVHQRLLAVSQADGTVAWRTNGQFTLLENGLHYRDAGSGEWTESRDLIERFPDGAIARHGPIRAIFSHDVNAESVFDLETPAGARLRGGLRALEWLDEVTGERQLLAGVKASAPLELVPPDRLVARDAFEGVLADVVLEWRHNRFSHWVVVRVLRGPPGVFAPAATRLVVVTEFLEAPEPEIQRVAVAAEAGRAAAEDHVAIHFEGASILLGHAFGAGPEGELTLGARGGEDAAAEPVRKVWTPDGAGGAVLEESVRWEALARLAADLPRQAQATPPGERDWRTARTERVSARRPVEVAQAPYEPAGLVVDFEIIPDNGIPTTFAMGQTYYVRTYYYNGSAVTFQPGCVIKFKHNAYLLLYGPVSFPDTLQTPVFTSKDDDGFGERIAGVAGEPDSDGNPPDQKAAQALWIYYVDFNTTVRNACIRWAQRGIQYDVNPGVYLTHTLQRSLLEHCSVGVYANLQDATLVLDQVEKHDVPTNISCPGYPYYPCGNISGTINQAPFYMDKSFAGLNGDDGDIVPDTMGATGLDHFLTTTTRGKIAVFDRNTGNRLSEELLSSFFDVPAAGDPRVWYDHQFQRWVVSAMYSDGDKVVVKISLSTSASLAASNWRRYEKTFSLGQNESVDFPTLGVDVNGIYLCTQIRGQGAARAGYKVWALKKSDVYTNPNYQPPEPLTVSAQELDTWCIQPAYNFDDPPVGGYAWLVAKGPPSGTLGGQIYFRRLQWNGSNPEWVGDWQAGEGSYRDYFDIPQKTGTEVVLLAPHKDGTALELGNVGSRLMTAVIRNGYLRTCHHVGLEGTDGDYDGSTPDRSAIQWFRLQVGTGGLTYAAHGRVYDLAASNPYWYHFPSLNVNAAGDLVVGFSGSRATEYIGAFWLGRKANGTWMNRPALVQAGRCPFAPNDHDRWGDYSATSVDPANGALWTIQQYADPAPDEEEGSEEWGTWIIQVKVAE